MEIFYLTTMFIISLSLGSDFIKSPDTSYELGERLERPPQCREADESVRYAEGYGRQGKAATYQLKGLYVCERGVFEYKDRHSFVTFVANSARHVAQTYAAKILNESYKNVHNEQGPWVVLVYSHINELVPYVRDVFQTELTMALGSGAVRRLNHDSYLPRLEVTVRNVQDMDILFDVAVKTKDQGAKELADEKRF